MPPDIFVQLGKFGDLLTILPLCKHYVGSDITTVITSSKYASVLEGCSYVDTVITDKSLPDAIQQAHSFGGNVRVTHLLGTRREIEESVYGKKYNVRMDSFQREMFYLADSIQLWKQNLPLEFDNRDYKRELEYIHSIDLPKKKTVLVSVDGESSPFRNKEILLYILKLKLGKTHNIIDLSNHEAHRLYDIVGLMEISDLLVASDSAILQLSHASKIPTIALIADLPSQWHGSAYRPHHIAHIRYSMFGKHLPDALDSLATIKYPFSWFNTKNKSRETRKIIHIYYGKNNWEKFADTYNDNNWIESRVSAGSITRAQDRKPFLKDVIRLGALRANPGDILCLTGDSTHIPEGLSDLLLSGSTPVTSPTISAFTPEWYWEHYRELEDVPCGSEEAWKTMRDTITKYGGSDI